MAAKEFPGWKKDPTGDHIEEKKALRRAHDVLAVRIKRLQAHGNLSADDIKKIQEDFEGLRDKITASDC